MQINLKQNDIITAVRGYITQQGINIRGKDVDVKFSMGRGEAGLSASVEITDAGLPDFGAEENKPALALVTAAAPAAAAAAEEAAPKAAEPVPAEVKAEAAAVIAQAADPAPAKTSLFN